MRALIITIILLLASALGYAQEHDHHDHHQQDTAATVAAIDPSTMMTASTSLSLPMTRNGSGTGWQPDASPMYAIMNHDLGGWQLMLHGSLFIRQTWVNINNSDKRSDSKFDAPNYVMAMAQRRIGENGLLSLQAMISLDPLTVGGAGYPLLFQTGESWEGKPLIDHQHPHDLFSSLAIAYTHRLSDATDITAYLGYPGEPALGPTAFMHRASSISNPDAPLGHHWLDATHIVFGVGTVGVRVGQFKAEGSIFTGKEPDENRYNFDAPLFDSYSWRLSWAPSRNITAQISQGYLNEPEFGSTTDVIRTTASMQFATGNADAWWSGMIAGGHNNAGHGHEEFAVLAEAAVDLAGTVPYLRAEWVQKSREELGFDEEGAHGIIEDITSVTLGISRRLTTIALIDVSIGAQATANFFGASLQDAYGNTPISAQVYLRLTPTMFGMM